MTLPYPVTHVLPLAMSTQRRPPAPRLDIGAKTYYKRIESILEGEEEGGEGAVYLKNVIDQVIADGVRLVSCDKDGSRALEVVLRRCPLDTPSLKKLLLAAREDFFKLCVNRCGSHVMQSVLHATGQVLVSQEEDEQLLQLFMECVSIIQNKMSDFIQHQYASHVLGGVVQDLGGVTLDYQFGRSRYSVEFRRAKMEAAAAATSGPKIKSVVPEVFVNALDKIAKIISKLEELPSLLTHQNASSALQCVLYVLHKRLPGRAGKLIKKLTKLSGVLLAGGESAESSSLPEILTDLVGSYLMDSILRLAPPTLQERVFEKCFKGRVMTAALHPVANFPLQQLIGSSTPNMLEEILTEVTALEELLFVGHTGLVVKLVEAAVSCSPPLQSSLLTSLLHAFHIDIDKHIKVSAPVILALMTYDVYYQKEDKSDDEEGVAQYKPHPSTLHGSLILQGLLTFENTRVVVRSVLGQSVEQLFRMCCDPIGSHVVTTFFNSRTVASKKKERMVTKLSDKLVALSKDRYGSRVIDFLWQATELHKKEELAKLFLAHEEELSADFHGSIVLRNCDIAHFRTKEEGWLEEQRKREKKRHMFQELVDGQCQVGKGDTRKRTGQDVFDEAKKKKRRSS